MTQSISNHGKWFYLNYTFIFRWWKERREKKNTHFRLLLSDGVINKGKKKFVPLNHRLINILFHFSLYTLPITFNINIKLNRPVYGVLAFPFLSKICHTKTHTIKNPTANGQKSETKQSIHKNIVSARNLTFKRKKKTIQNVVYKKHTTW